MNLIVALEEKSGDDQSQKSSQQLYSSQINNLYLVYLIRTKIV